MKNRLTICVFWDKEGVLREYALFYIKALKEFSEKLLVVVNGFITEASQKTLEELGCKVVKRENRALDFGAYKFGLSFIGYENLNEYDEVILTNTTCYGPVFPFSEMFDEMEKRDCDFWGITEHNEYDDQEWLKKHVYSHLQSYFLVFRRRLFLSKEFFEFFNEVKDEKLLAYKQIINLYETELTHYFESFGYKSSCYIDCKSYYDEKNLNPCYFSTSELIVKERIPLVKRKAIIFDPDTLLKSFHANKCIDVLQSIKKCSSYDINMIMNDLIRDYPLSKLKFAFHLNYVLPDDYEQKFVETLFCKSALEEKNDKNDFLISSYKNCERKCALILFINSLDNIEFILNKVVNVPDGSYLIFVIKNENVEVMLRNLISSNEILKQLFISFTFEFRLGNDKTDIYDAFYLMCKDIYEKFEYVFCLQTFDDTFLKSDKLYKTFFSDMINSLLSSKNYVKNLLNRLDADPYVGLVTTNLPLTNTYDDSLWGRDVDVIDDPEIVRSLRKFYNINVPKDNVNLACYCGMYISRSKAFKDFLNTQHNFNILRSKGVTLDYVIKSALDFILPQIVQEASYLTASTMPLSGASRYIDCMFFNNRVTEYTPCPVVYNFKSDDYEQKYVKRFIFKDIFKYLFTIRKTPDNRFKYLTIFGFNILLKRAKNWK